MDRPTKLAFCIAIGSLCGAMIGMFAGAVSGRIELMEAGVLVCIPLVVGPMMFVLLRLIIRS